MHAVAAAVKKQEDLESAMAWLREGAVDIHAFSESRAQALRDLLEKKGLPLAELDTWTKLCLSAAGGNNRFNERAMLGFAQLALDGLRGVKLSGKRAGAGVATEVELSVIQPVEEEARTKLTRLAEIISTRHDQKPALALLALIREVDNTAAQRRATNFDWNSLEHVNHVAGTDPFGPLCVPGPFVPKVSSPRVRAGT